jgi:hypothetical protein
MSLAETIDLELAMTHHALSLVELSQVHACTYTGGGSAYTVHYKEGALGDGVGARLWAVAHLLCR